MKISLFFFLLISNFAFSQEYKIDSLNIFYETGKFNIDQFYYKKIDSFLNIKNMLNVKSVEIISYTDAVGSKQSNDSLSFKRAITILDLVKEKYSYHDYSFKFKGEHFKSDSLKKENPLHRLSTIKRIIEIVPQNDFNCYLEELLTLQPKNETIVLKDIHFEWGRHRLLPESLEQVYNLYHFLKKNPNLVIEIQGHVCCGRPKEAKGLMKSHHNLKLSSNRAKEVKKALVNLGINEQRIETNGYGFTRPRVFPQKNIDDAYQNRRIEIAYITK